MAPANTGRSLGTRLVILLAIAAVSAGTFAWGFACAKKKIFPYKIVRALAGKAGVASREVNDPTTVKSEAFDASQLVALPYLQASFDPNADLSGVVHHDEDLASPGYNLYTSVSKNEAKLIDMDGREIQDWTVPGPRWQFATLTPDGGLLALAPYDRLMKLDRRSNVLWEHIGRVHHVATTYEGKVYVLSQEHRVVPRIDKVRQVIDETIDVIDESGTFVESISILDSLLRSPYRFLLPQVTDLEVATDKPLDVLHVNHIEFFDGSHAERSPLFAEGNALISIRNINAIGILEAETWDLIWLWGPSNVIAQHHPTMLENGNILIFNNGTDASSILELEPLSEEIVWKYAAEGFFSKTRGSNQRLANGNTLITDSDKGYVFEITPEGETVWHFANPDVDNAGKRGAIFRMTRYEKGDPRLARLAGREPTAAPDGS